MEFNFVLILQVVAGILLLIGSGLIGLALWHDWKNGPAEKPLSGSLESPSPIAATVPTIYLFGRDGKQYRVDELKNRTGTFRFRNPENAGRLYARLPYMDV